MFLGYQNILITGSVLLSFSVGSLAKPIVARQSTSESGGNTGSILSAVGGALLSDTISKAIGEPPSCYQGFSPQPCRAMVGNHEGKSWSTCFQFGDQEFSQADSNVVQCIINLHTLQDDTCISVKGSSCDLDDYVANGGRVQNVLIPTIGSGATLTSAQSVALQAGTYALVGQKIRTDSGSLAHNPYIDGEGNGIYIRYIGQDAC